MGRDKSRLRLGRSTFLGQIKRTAAQLHLPIRVIRKDLIPNCGPLSGAFTGLKKSKVDAVLFLSCDMPFVGVELLRRLIATASGRREAVFVSTNGVPGFPFVLPATALPVLERMLGEGRRSLWMLAKKLAARKVRVRGPARELMNINTPDELVIARRSVPRPRLTRR